MAKSPKLPFRQGQPSLGNWGFSLMANSRNLSHVVASVLKRNVYVEFEKNFGSGVHLDNHRILTVHHIKEDQSWIKVNRRRVEILYEDKEADLMLLGCNTRGYGPLTIRTEVNYLDPLVVVGNLPQKHRLVSLGNVMGMVRSSKPSRSRFYFSNKILDGFSGGGIYLPTGELVGLVCEVHGHIETGRQPAGIPGSTIRKFLQEYERKTEVRAVGQLDLDLTG